jgi:GNAT superfamily N-acetyltransferase
VAAYQYAWRGAFTNDELNVLHAAAFDYPVEDVDWLGQVQRHSLGWVTARNGSELIGFVNVPWDGGMHAFILDTIVSARTRRQGVGAQLVQIAAQQAGAAGCCHLHVERVEAQAAPPPEPHRGGFKGPSQGPFYGVEELRPFYLGRCGFRPTAAGTLPLPAGDDPTP